MYHNITTKLIDICGARCCGRGCCRLGRAGLGGVEISMIHCHSGHNQCNQGQMGAEHQHQHLDLHLYIYTLQYYSSGIRNYEVKGEVRY